MTKLWHTDGEKPGSLTSMDILVRWLRAPGNYKRWKSGAKLSLLQEIAGEIKKHGAATRSPAAVRRKLIDVEQQFETATTWLRETGQLVAYMDGVASESVVQGVQQRCLHHYELSTVFHTTDACSGTKHGDQTTDAIDNGSAEEKQKRAKLPVQGHQKRSSDALGDNQRLKKQKQKALESGSARVQQDNTRVEEKSAEAVRSIVVLGERSLALAEFKRESETRWNEYCGVKLTPCLKEEGEKLAQQLLQREIEHVDAMAKLQFEAELKRQELQTKCEMVLSRHKLRVAGVSEEDVESMIPSEVAFPSTGA
ncbi:hypothetical protein PInf_016302 [Phytophthora infestans]|nr:hypothetical protein PInf_016302 [Phytophthora infestans]